MSSISDKGSYDHALEDLRSLVDTEPPPSLQDARIKTLVDSIFQYLNEHPDLQTNRQVIQLRDRLSMLAKLEASSNASKTGSVVFDSMPRAEWQPEPTASPVLSQRQPPSSLIPTAKLLFNLLGDEFGGDSELGAISIREVLGFVIKYIKWQRSLSSSFLEGRENILYELEIAFLIDRIGLSNALLSPLLASNKPFLIAGGWVKIPVGHTVYYEILPQQDGTVNFRIFNTGVGIEEHEKTRVGIKKKVAFLEWKGILKDKLLDPHFAQIINEMMTILEYPNIKNPGHKKRTDYSAKEIYLSLKSFLEPTSIESGLDAPLIEPQRGATCTCRALFAFLKSKLSLEEYQRIKLDLRMQALSSFLYQPKESKVSPEVQYHLAERATAKLSRRVLDLYGRVIKDAEVTEADVKLKVAEQWFSNCRSSQRTLVMDHSYNDPINPFVCDPRPPIALLLEAPHEIPSREMPLYDIMQQISLYPLNISAIFTENIRIVSELLKRAYEKGEYSAVHFAITNLIKTIPMEAVFWEAIQKTASEIEGAINHLGTLSELFFKSCYRIQDSSAVFCEKEDTLRKIIVTEQKLAQILKIRVAIPLDFRLDYIQRNFYIQNLDPLFANRLRSAFPEDYSAPPLFFPFEFHQSPLDKSELFCSLINNSDPLFFTLIKETYPEVLEKIRADDPAFDTQDPKKQAALLFISPYLPPWIQSIKKSVVSLAYIQSVPIFPLTDPTVSLDFSYSYKDQSSSILIYLMGITSTNFNNLPSDKEMEVPIFSTNQTPIKHPMIREIVSIAAKGYWYEKFILSAKEPGIHEYLQYLSFRKKYSPPFTEMEIDELVHIFSSPNKSLIEALEYFTLHSEKLSDLDYQQLFQMACFYFKASDKITEFKGQITQFLFNQIALTLETQDIKTLVFLQRMGRYFKKFGCDTPDITRHLLELLTRAIKPEEKSLIYAELSASLSENTVLSQDQLILLLSAKAWTQHTPIPVEWKDPKTIYDMEKALSLHSAALRELLLPEARANTALLNHIYTLINEESPPRDLRWEAINSPGISPRFTTNQNDFYDPISGNLFTIGQKSYLPLEIREEVIFKELFPDQLTAIAKSRDTYEFSLEGSIVIVRKTELGLSLEQYKDGEWLRLIPSSNLTASNQDNVSCALESRYLADKYYVWHSLTEPTKMFLYDKKTKVKTHQLLYDLGHITRITRLADGAFLSKPSELLAHIENPSYIQEWYQGSKRIEIEIPRFKLSFKPDALGRLACQQHEGFFLNENQNVAAIGSCTYPIILKNEYGAIRVILPHQYLQATLSKESLAPYFRRDQSLGQGKSADFTYFTYDLQPNGYLESSSQEGYFYLVQTLAVHREYEKAAYYLRKYGEKLSRYSEKEIKALKEIAYVKIVTGDDSGEQVAIALYANYLLATNEIHSPDAPEVFSSLYQQYLIRSRNITALRLSKEEELHLLVSLLPEPLTDQFAARLEELLDRAHTPKASEAGYATPPLLPAISININELKTLILHGAATPLPPFNETSVLITRPADFIKNYLKEFIKIAIEGRPDDQIKWLKTACLFLKTSSEDQNNASLGIVIEQILKNPGEFTPPPDSSAPSAALINLLPWWETTLQKVNSLLSQKALSPTPASRRPLDRRRDHRTDRDDVAIPDYPFKFIPLEFDNLCTDPAIASATTLIEHPVSVNPELMKFLASQRSKDPVESNEWARLVEDAATLSKKPPKPFYTFLGESTDITPILLVKKAQIKDSLTYLEQQMLFIAALTPTQDPLTQALFSLKKRGGLLKTITLDDIFISLGSKDPKKLLEQNPYLQQEALHNLYHLASIYLQVTSHRDQVDRSLALCKKITEDPQSQDLRHELGQQLNTKRCYTIAEHPEYLVFEYYAGIIMREDQVGKLDAFIRREGTNPFMEMIMGSGKSKVLLPLLGLLRADGRALSMVVVPAPLFENVSSDTQAIQQRAFAKSLKTLHFDRNSTFTKRSLEEIKTFLETVITKKQCLIMTSKSIQSLILKFIEYANSIKDSIPAETDELKVMIEIISLLQTAGSPLIDEADTVLNVLHEVSFSLGQKVTPKQEEIHLIGTLYELLYSAPELKHIARLESDPQPDMAPEIPPLTEEVYHNQLKERLAQALIRKLIEQNQLPKDVDQAVVLAYISRDKDKASPAQRFFAAQAPEVQNLLALAAEEICSLLPHTLLKTSDERYGLDRGVIAIPFAAANTPSHGSLFSNPYITMNYTFQIHSKNGIKEETLIRVIKQLKKQSDIQMREELMPIEKTIGYQKFCLLRGELPIPFNNHLDLAQLTSILDRINNHPLVRQELIEKLFLPQMDLFENKLSCNPINLIALFSKVSGFTGTLWNARSMHSKIQPLPEPGTDAKTLNLLIEKSMGPALIISKVEESSMFEGLPLHDALIDAGGYFKEGGNLAIARKMALTLKKSVVFYDSKGVQTITDGKDETPLSASPLKEEDRLTFYDQSHTTGADIKQKAAAVGLVTIGRGMILRDLLQSVWRLRGLEKGQTVQFIMDKEVASIIKAQIGSGETPIGFKEILKFVIQNQAKQQGDDNFKSFKQELDNLSQNLLLEVMTNKTPDYTPMQKQLAFRELCKTWIKPANQLPAELYGNPAFKRPSQEVIAEAAHNCLAQLEAIGRAIPFLLEKIDGLKAQIRDLADRASPSVHSQVISSQSDTSSTVEIEQTNEIATQISTEMETEGANQLEPIQLGYIPQFSGKLKRKWERVDSLSSISSLLKTILLFPIADQMSREPGLEKYQYLFEGIDMSINVLSWKKGEENLIDKMRLLGPRRTPFHHLVIEGDTVTLFSALEDSTNHLDYYNLTLGFKDPTRKLSSLAFEKVVKLKFLNGQSSFTKEELVFLESWFIKEGVDKLETLYLKHILKFQPDKKIAFKYSSLNRLFKRLKDPRPLAGAPKCSPLT